MSLHWSNATHVLCSQPILSKLAQSVLANDLQQRNIHLVRCHPPNRPPCARTGTRTALHCKARRKPTPSSPRRVPTRVRCLHRGRSTHWSTTRSSNQLVKVCSNANTQPNALLMRAFFFLKRGCQGYSPRVADGREEQGGEGNSHPDANVFAPLAHLSWSMKELVNDRRGRTCRAPVEANRSARRCTQSL